MAPSAAPRWRPAFRQGSLNERRTGEYRKAFSFWSRLHPWALTQAVKKEISAVTWECATLAPMDKHPEAEAQAEGKMPWSPLRAVGRSSGGAMEPQQRTGRTERKG